jgi:undecaprenyl-diphosphatase
MDLTHAVGFSALEGLTMVLPLSDSGHQLVARMWLGAGPELDGIHAFAELGCLIAVAIVTRRRLAAALSEGIRGIARPALLQQSGGGRDAIALVLAALTATVSETLLSTWTSPLNAMPVVVGVALMLGAAGLWSTRLAPAPEHTQPNALGALLVGLAHGLAVVPGASQVGAAFVVLRWLGVSGWSAAEMALLVSAPVLAFRAARRWLTHPDWSVGMSGSEIALVIVVAFSGAALAAAWWRALAEKHRTPLLSMWLVPLGLAVLAYDRALPAMADARPPQRVALCRVDERLRADHGGRLGYPVLARVAQGAPEAAARARG